MQIVKKSFFTGIFILLSANIGFAQHKLTLQFSDFGIHIGNAFFIRVIDKATGSEVGREKLESIPAADFEVDLWVLITGNSYQIDFFADANNNDQYNAPPVDHAYRLDLDNAQGDEIVPFSHNPGFTDIEWPPPAEFTAYAGTWRGTWNNLTYGTSAEIESIIEVIPDSQIIRITSTTSGVFGNPAVITQTTETTYTENADSIVMPAAPPWTGSAVVTHGAFNGVVTAPGNFILNLDGNFGPDQMISEYMISGAVDANGIIVMFKEEETGIAQRIANPIPTNFQLGQNYPNPFNPTTTIPFSIDKAGYVSVTLYDATGRQLETLFNGPLSAGTYELNYNGSEHASGLYFYRIQTDNANRVRKMILSK